MQSTSAFRLLVSTAVLGIAFLSPALATDATKGKEAPPRSALDNDEMAHLTKVRAQVLNANPDLKEEEEKLKSMHTMVANQNPAPTTEQQNAAYAEWKDYQKKMRAAMLKVDPTVAPIFAKLDTARKNGTPAPFKPATKGN